MNGHPKYKEILDRMWELHDSKARSYGSDGDPLANLRNGERFGMPAWKRCIVEADSAFYRLQNYCNGRNQSAASAKDALMDTAAFSLLALLFIEELEADVDAVYFSKAKASEANPELFGEFIPKDNSVMDSTEPAPPAMTNGVAMADALFTGVFGMKRVDPGYRKPSEEVGKRIAEVLEKAT